MTRSKLVHFGTHLISWCDYEISMKL